MSDKKTAEKRGRRRVVKKDVIPIPSTPNPEAFAKLSVVGADPEKTGDKEIVLLPIESLPLNPNQFRIFRRKYIKLCKEDLSMLEVKDDRSDQSL